MNSDPMLILKNTTNNTDSIIYSNLNRRHSFTKFDKENFELLNRSDVETNKYLEIENQSINFLIRKTQSSDEIDINQNKSANDIFCKLINCKYAFKKEHSGKKYHWIQLSGHAGHFIPGEREGFILKILSHSERENLLKLKVDSLAKFVPNFDKIVLNKLDNNYYLEIQDLLYNFSNPSIMDIKIGTRTFLDVKEKPRKDLYERLIKLAPDFPTEHEHAQKALTKIRYMQWRDSGTCSSKLGFRIQAIKKMQVSEDFFNVKEREQVIYHFKKFTDNNKRLIEIYLRRLIDLKSSLIKSMFFKTHEMIGTSILFIHDMSYANIWMIDFAKVNQLPLGVEIDHLSKWEPGNYEDGYLEGINSLINIFEQMITSY